MRRMGVMGIMGNAVLALAVCLVISVAEPIPAIDATLSGAITNDAELQGCSLGCAVDWKVESSSSLPEQAGNRHDAIMLNDWRLDTAWIESQPDYGIGEWIRFVFAEELWEKSAPTADKIRFRGFRMLNGYSKSEPVWKANSRVKSFRLLHNNVPLFDINLRDSMEQQVIYFNDVWLRAGDVVELKITGVYPGDSYKDTAITELMPDGAH
ncbi:MAG: hypothetical protein SGI88_08705 [Candidatus Hydrogenedentes bacterium]|nr:hypothetical protein [Candidatus Hydrogenedentota bacterium]